jgi:hypothetical protein
LLADIGQFLTAHPAKPAPLSTNKFRCRKSVAYAAAPALSIIVGARRSHRVTDASELSVVLTVVDGEGLKRGYTACANK